MCGGENVSRQLGSGLVSLNTEEAVQAAHGALHPLPTVGADT